ncbi:MAG: universal stress protein [Rubrivivax sp.]|nr:universal stress protein [Rubrivivax sp.]MDH5339449.1 universal stress protein [Rubrivivax sp.]
MFKKLLVPVDGTEVSQHAVQQGVALARQMGVGIVGYVVEAMPALPGMGTHLPTYRQEVKAHEAQTDGHARRVLAHFAEAAQAAGVPFEGHYDRNDDVAAAIAAAAASQGCDMIVMATHGRGPFGAMLFGSQTKRVMALSRVPLLVLH